MDGHANFLRCNLHICTSIVVYPAWKQGWNRAAGRNPMDEAVLSMIGWPYMLRVVPLSLSLSWMTWKKPAPVTWRKQRGKMAPRDPGGEKAVSFDRLSERGTNRGLTFPNMIYFWDAFICNLKRSRRLFQHLIILQIQASHSRHCFPIWWSLKVKRTR